MGEIVVFFRPCPAVRLRIHAAPLSVALGVPTGRAVAPESWKSPSRHDNFSAPRSSAFVIVLWGEV